jgi:hypothetical protein
MDIPKLRAAEVTEILGPGASDDVVIDAVRHAAAQGG